MKNGISIFIFPEGTRNKHEEPLLLPFKEGSFKMAEKSGCPIVPVALTNTREIFENHLPFVHPCKVIIEYGTPIHPNELSKEEKKHLGGYTQKMIEEMLLSHKNS
jgi:1-acyl-sn-glycerol-3-phosphate acyltransferase